MLRRGLAGTVRVLPALDLDGMPIGWPQDHGIATLGPSVLAWSSTELAQPDGDGAGEPWEWRESQARFVQWWYALDEMGGWLFRRGQIVLPKGSGKSPIAAALSCCELAGPVVFDRFDPDYPGGAVGKTPASPWVQLAAVSQDQTDNTMTLVLAMLREGGASKSIPGLDTGITRVLTRIGRLQPVTASSSSREGQRLTGAILDETHLWTKTNGGLRLASTIRRNLAKMGGRSIETTNAWIAGEQSVAENTSAYADKAAEESNNRLDRKILRWHPMAPVDDLADETELRSGLEQLYADSPWIDIDRIVDEIYDLGTTPSDARRFYLNQMSAEDDAWLAEYEWAALGPKQDEPASFKVVADKDVITLGFDGSRGRGRGVSDATALVACRVRDGHVFPIGVWEHPEGPAGQGWEVPVGEVDAAVRTAFDRYSVVGFYADPALWDEHVARWEATYGSRLKIKASREHPIRWAMNRGLVVVQATAQFHAAVLNGEMSHDGSYTLTRHVLNARRRISRSGTQIAKAAPESPNKIDAAVAAVVAYQARLDAVAAGLGTARRKPIVPSRIR